MHAVRRELYKRVIGVEPRLGVAQSSVRRLHFHFCKVATTTFVTLPAVVRGHQLFKAKPISTSSTGRLMCSCGLCLSEPDFGRTSISACAGYARLRAS